MKTKITICLLCLIMLSLSCSNSREQEAANIVYRLKWLFNISVIGDVYAEAHGAFAAQGLNVTVKPGGPERDAIKELEIGRAQFGVASADQVIRAISKGSPIVVLAQLFQTNPLQWIYRSEKNRIISGQDLRNKTIGITYGGNDETIMRTLLIKLKINDDEVNLFSVRYDYTPFYEGKVDLWPIYRNAEGTIIADKLAENGEKAGFFDPHVWGVNFVANSVITTREMLERHPAIVNKFILALLQSWQEALAENNEIIALQVLAKYDTDTRPDLLKKQMVATRQLMTPPSGKPFGWIDIQAWQQTEKIMLDQNLITAPIHIEKFLKTNLLRHNILAKTANVSAGS